MHRDADGAGLVGDGPGDGLADPPRGVGGELIPPSVVELLHRPNEPDVPLLGQIEERHPVRRVPLGDRDHQAKVRLDQPLPGQPAIGFHPPQELDRLGAVLGPIRPSHLLEANALVLKLSLRVELVLADPEHGANQETEPLLVDPARRVDGGKHLGGEPPGLHPHGQVDLLGGGEETDFADLVQVQPDRIVGEDLRLCPAGSRVVFLPRLRTPSLGSRGLRCPPDEGTPARP